MKSEATLAFASFLFAVVAGWFFYAGLSIPVAVATEAGDVANLQLMQIQSTNIAIGIGAAVIAAILATGSAVVGVIRQASVAPE